MSLSMLPSSLEMEAAVLGAILQEPLAAMPDAAALLSPAHFYFQDNRTIWEAVARVHRRGTPPDAVAVMAELTAHGYLESVGGREKLEELVAAVPGASAVEAHCEVLHGYALRRQFITEMTEQVRAAYDAKQEMPAVIDRTEAAMTRVTMASDRTEITTGAEAIESFISEGFEIDQDEEGTYHWYRKWGMPCGVKHLDRILKGFRRGSMSLILAGANVGKTMLMLNMANYFADKGPHPTLFYSVEQPRGEVGQRLIAIRSGVADEDMFQDLNREKRIDPAVVNAVKAAADCIREMPLYIDDCPRGLSLRRLKSETRRAVRKYGVQVVMIDYAQILDFSAQPEERYDLKVTTFSHGIKALARELGIHIMIASQITREATKNTAGEPTLQSARETQSLAEDADYVLGLWNPLVAKKDEGDPKKVDEAARTINIRVLKNRFGGGKGQRADVRMLPGRCKIIALTRDHFEMTLEDIPDGEVKIDGAGPSAGSGQAGYGGIEF